jgi:hypothetical protein
MYILLGNTQGIICPTCKMLPTIMAHRTTPCSLSPCRPCVFHYESERGGSGGA